MSISYKNIASGAGTHTVQSLMLTASYIRATVVSKNATKPPGFRAPLTRP